MYRTSSPGQLSFENFYLPFGGNLSSENRRVKLAKLIPWDEFEQAYAKQFSPGMGAPAKPFRMALASLIIKEKLGTSDEETVAQIGEHPYLQYFIGMSEYQERAPFDASMLVHFRKRLSLELITSINETVVQAMLNPQTEEEQSEESPCEDGAQEPSQETVASPSNEQEKDPGTLPNAGQLIVDATCAPADIRYPTDLGVLNEAREWSERLIDELYAPLQGTLARKPRTYRQLARQRYLAIAKKRKPSRRLIRKGIGQQ